MKKNLKIKCMLFPLIGIVNSANAASYNIGTGGGTMFQKITSLLQSCIDFLTGPFGDGVVVISVILGAAVFMFAPKEGWLAIFLRAFVGGAVILNVGIWMGVIK